MLKRLLGEPFKGQASVRALDEGDATGEHTSTSPQAHPTCQDWEGHAPKPVWLCSRPSQSRKAFPAPCPQGLKLREAGGKCLLRDEPPGGNGCPPEGQAMGWRTQTNVFQVRKECSLRAASQGQKQGTVSAWEPPHHLPAPAPWSVRTPRHWDPARLALLQSRGSQTLRCWDSPNYLTRGNSYVNCAASLHGRAAL